MSLGKQFLRAVIKNQDKRTFRKLEPDWLNPKEVRGYNYLNDYLTRYHELPSYETFKREVKIALPRVEDTPEYFLDKLIDRAKFNVIQEALPEAFEDLKKRKVGDCLDKLKEVVRGTRSIGIYNTFDTIQLASGKLLEYLEEVQLDPGNTGVPMGWETFDELTGGVLQGDLVALVGRPNQGKTYLLLNMLKNAWESGKSCFLLSMEMTNLQIITRYMGMMCGFNPKYIRSGELPSRQHRLLLDTIEHLDNYPPLWLMSGDIDKKVADVEELVEETDADMYFIDGAYLLKPNGKYYKSKWEALNEVMETLKQLALRTKKRFVCTYQLNRSADIQKTKNKDLDLAFIGGTDSIGQIATIVIGVKPGADPLQELTRRLEMIKNREGPLGKITVNNDFIGMNFDELHQDNLYSLRQIAAAHTEYDEVRNMI